MVETGHAKNVANFESMISFVAGYGGDYKPSNASIQPSELQIKLTAAQGRRRGCRHGNGHVSENHLA